MIEMGNEKIVTGRIMNQNKTETQLGNVKVILPSQNQNPNETHHKIVKRMVGWSIPPTVKFTVTPIPKYRIG